MRPRSRFWILTAMTSLLLVGCVRADPGALITPEADTATADYEYVIPPGTGDRIRAGDDVEILPAELEVHVGETIRITNEDTEGHFIGIFYVGAGETATQRFASQGEYTGQCTVHPSGQLSLRILP